MGNFARPTCFPQKSILLIEICFLFLFLLVNDFGVNHALILLFHVGVRLLTRGIETDKAPAQGALETRRPDGKLLVF